MPSTCRRATLSASAAGLALVPLLLSAGVGAAPAAAAPPPSPTATPQVSDKPGESAQNLPKVPTWTWVVADADTGAVLAGRDWHHQLPPASTLKVLTAETLAPRLDPASIYTAQKADAEAEGMRVGLETGLTYSVNDLLKGMMMPSGNDAARALGMAYGGVGRAVNAMQQEAERIGAKDTVVKNTSGLDEPGQVSSAYDLALIMRESLRNPELREIYSLHDTMFPGKTPKEAGGERVPVKIWTENRLILNGPYEGAIAGKTGFTSQAGRTFVAAVERGGKTLIVALMRCAESTEKISKRLFEWGFANIDKVKPVDNLVAPQPMKNIADRMPAAQYDAQGKLMTPLVSEEPQETGSSAGTLLLLAALLTAGALVALRVRAKRMDAERRRRRVHAAATRAYRAQYQPGNDIRPKPPATIDLRDKDNTRI